MSYRHVILYPNKHLSVPLHPRKPPRRNCVQGSSFVSLPATSNNPRRGELCCRHSKRQYRLGSTFAFIIFPFHVFVIIRQIPPLVSFLCLAGPGAPPDPSAAPQSHQSGGGVPGRFSSLGYCQRRRSDGARRSSLKCPLLAIGVFKSLLLPSIQRSRLRRQQARGTK